ncbi:phage holin family protein [Peptoniphilus harei]|uniref:phage holin family protein n=1 Tax=Peptoniphilus harei TaxID=54005 RepID=UPI0011DD3FB4|nr:phage holin family protein [Peptoniphilus harei]
MQDLVFSLKEYLSPELVFMIPVLVVIGKVLKKSNRISDSLIPTILSIVGIPIALVTSLANRMDPMNSIQIVVWILMSIGQGVFLGATAVGVHQFFKQHTEFKNLKDWEMKEDLIKEFKESMEDKNECK